MFEKELALARIEAKKYLKAYSLSGKAIELGVVLLILAIIIGQIALPIFFSTNTTGWGATNILVWGTLPTITLAAFVIGIFAYFKYHSGGE